MSYNDLMIDDVELERLTQRIVIYVYGHIQDRVSHFGLCVYYDSSVTTKANATLPKFPMKGPKMGMFYIYRYERV
jgi:hypothetical protein